MMLLSSKSFSPVSCNFPSIPRTSSSSRPLFVYTPKTFQFALNQPILRPKLQYINFHICHDSANKNSKIVAGEEEDEKQGSNLDRKVDDGNDWSTSVLLFGFWAGVMYYVFKLAPDQTPVLCSSASKGSQLSQKEVWPQQ